MAFRALDPGGANCAVGNIEKLKEKWENEGKEKRRKHWQNSKNIFEWMGHSAELNLRTLPSGIE